jgi:hypothetical protein
MASPKRLANAGGTNATVMAMLKNFSVCILIEIARNATTFD